MAGKRTNNGIVTLRAIGVTEDGLYLTLARRANAKSGGWRVPVDEELLTWLEEAIQRAKRAQRAAAGIEEVVTPRAPRADSKLSPKEIQNLLRQGSSVTSIAKKAGVPPEWVARFEGPIIWEREGMATRAKKTILERSRRGPSALPLGEAVEANLRSKGVPNTPELIESGWDARRRSRSDRWIITFSYPSRNRDLSAQWEFDPEGGVVTPLDPLASRLGWVETRSRRKAGTGG